MRGDESQVKDSLYSLREEAIEWENGHSKLETAQSVRELDEPCSDHKSSDGIGKNSSLTEGSPLDDAGSS